MPAKEKLPGVAEARAAILAQVTPLPSESVALEAALGRVLAEPVVAGRDQPPFAVSAMDGYAVRHADTPGTLTVVGESAAGRGFAGTIGVGEAVRISTGAAVPDGADAVVMQEDVTREEGRITAPAVPSNACIRSRGGDFAAGAVLIAAGRRLDGVALSLAAASGAAKLQMESRPRIAILSSGDELAAPGTTPGPYQIYDSATYGIAGLVESWGGTARRLPVEQDAVDAIMRAAEQGLRNSDLLVVLGGASVGDHDHAKPALTKLGLTMKVAKIAVRPGKPCWFGVTPQGPVLGLPGNPASALVCAYLFLKPLIAVMQRRDGEPVFQRARLAQALPANGPREHYLRSKLIAGDQGQSTVRAFEDQDSSLLSVFAAANALIRLPPHAPALEQGAVVDVLPLDTAGC